MCPEMHVEKRSGQFTQWDQSGNFDEIMNEWIHMTWLKGAQKVDEFGESDEFVKSDDSDEISPRL